MYPDHLYIFGAGRWSRVICKALLKFLPAQCTITIISKGHAPVMKVWAQENRLPVQVSDVMPAHTGKRAAIVTNAAKDHAPTTEILLRQGIPVLVEKPLALSIADVEKLIALSRETGTFLAVSHIFLFASYLESFARRVRALPAFNGGSFIWEDPTAEKRYGEAKSYDASLSVVQDVFPHIYSILNFLLPESSITYRSHTLARDGAETRMQLTVNNAPFEVVLGRDSPQRVRRIIFEAVDGNTTLDFTNEPGTITSGGQSHSGDPLWQKDTSPLTQQIHAFFAACAGQSIDPRLSPAIDRAATRIIEATIQG